MSDSQRILDEAREALAGAGEPEKLPRVVMRFHRQVDAMVETSLAVHGARPACARGCSYCCNMQVDVLPPEAFALAAWLKAHLDDAGLRRVADRVAANAARTREIGIEARKRENLPCALLGEDGACTAYAARPAQCRRFHSLALDTCLASHARPDDDSIESPAHPLVMHNVQVVVTAAQQGVRAEGRDAQPVDMNLALHEVLGGNTAWRRWRDGKKAFVGAAAEAPAA